MNKGIVVVKSRRACFTNVQQFYLNSSMAVIYANKQVLETD